MTNIFITADTLKKLKTRELLSPNMMSSRYALPDDKLAMIFFPEPNDSVAVVFFAPDWDSYRGRLIHGIKQYGFVAEPNGVKFINGDIQNAMYGFVYLAIAAVDLFAKTKQAEGSEAMSRSAKRLALSCGVKGNTYRILDLSAPINTHIPEAHESCPSGVKQRWHMRRGHYRTLRSGKQVFVRACYAGDKAIGIVHKDYAL